MLMPSKNTALIQMLKSLIAKIVLLLHKMTINAIRDKTRVLPLGGGE